jgi:hypothetical protein
MNKIIFQDIKLNRNRIKTSDAKELKEIPELKQKFIDNNSINEKKETSENTKIYNQPVVIDKYFKDDHASKKRIESTPQQKKKKPIINKYISLLFFLTLIIIVIYFGQSLFEKVDVSIKSKQELISYDEKQFIAKKEINGESINFIIMMYPEKKFKKVFLTDSETVSKKAKGVMTFYNEYSLNPQKIVTETFVSDETGKTYLTQEAVTIPGYRILDGEIVPGQIDVTIEAFLAGSNYNGEPNDFFVNAFKDDIKYSKIYGKLKNPLIGGISGLAYSLNEVDKENLVLLINDYYKEELIAKVKASVPAGYILYPKAMKFSYNINDEILSEEPETEIEIDELLSVVLIEENSLIAGIIKTSLPLVSRYDTREIMIPDLNKLDFNFTENNQEITKDIDLISFNLNGDLRVIWRPDINKLKDKLKGVKKDEALPIFRQESGIASALVKFFPPWKRYFPEDSERINIVLEDIVD